MDDLSRMMFDSLSVEKQLRTAVMSNMLDTVVKILEERGPSLLNTPLYTENLRTALHLACEENNHEMVKVLVDAGGDVNALDLFRLTPLALALRHGRDTCAKIILQNSSWHPGTIWHENDGSRGPTWINFPEQVLCLLVIGTPNSLVHENIDQPNLHFFFGLCERFQGLTKAFYLTGNHLPRGHVLQFRSDSADLSQWVRGMLGVQTLQHYARIAVRRSLNTNVFFGASKLPLPVALQKCLLFVEELPF